jgi:hypothetical protein
MTSRAKQHLNRVIPSSRFNFGDYISRGFDLWKEQVGLYIAFTVIFFVVSSVVGLIPFVGSIVNQLFITPLLTAGAYLFSHKLANRERADFSYFFDVTDYAGRIIGVYAVYLLALVLIILPFIFIFGFDYDVLTGGDPEAIASMFTEISPLVLLGIIPIVLLTLAISYSSHFIMFFDMSILDSISYSAKLFFKHPFIMFLFFLIVGLIAASGIIGLCVAIIVTYPMIYPMTYIAFRDLTQLDSYESNEGDQDVYNTLLDI